MSDLIAPADVIIGRGSTVARRGLLRFSRGSEFNLRIWATSPFNPQLALVRSSSCRDGYIGITGLTLKARPWQPLLTGVQRTEPNDHRKSYRT